MAVVLERKWHSHGKGKAHTKFHLVLNSENELWAHVPTSLAICKWCKWDR